MFLEMSNLDTSFLRHASEDGYVRRILYLGRFAQTFLLTGTKSTGRTDASHKCFAYYTLFGMRIIDATIWIWKYVRVQGDCVLTGKILNCCRFCD